MHRDYKVDLSDMRKMNKELEKETIKRNLLNKEKQKEFLKSKNKKNREW